MIHGEDICLRKNVNGEKRKMSLDFEEYELGNNGDVKVERRGEANNEGMYLVDFFFFLDFLPTLALYLIGS
jgi:hypothetical protein